MCGLERASGQAIIAMDADLQDPPEVALQMIAKWKEGYDVVHGKRRKRKGETIFKKGTAFVFYRLLRKITGLDLREFEHAITFKVALMVKKYLTNKPVKF